MKRFDPKIFLERVGDGRTITSRRAGETIFKQGDHADLVFYLQLGKAKESVTSDQGKDAVIGMLEPGFFFGTGSLDGGNVRLSTVKTITPCVVTAITVEAMMEALKEPSFAQLFVAYLLQHNSRIEAEKADLLLNHSEKRLAQKLLMLAHFGKGEPQIIGPEITQEMLAAMIGTTRGRVNYFLNRFRHMGLVTYNGGIQVLPGLLKAVLHDNSEPEEK